MPVHELQNASLSTMISARKVDYSCVYKSLCECAQKMLDKYEQKQEFSTKNMVKTRAACALLVELSKVPTDARITREIILSALKCHAEELQGYEHLLSAKGNNYELMKQTQGLGKKHDVPASLIRYHDLKTKMLRTKVLAPDTPLKDEQRSVISQLARNKKLTLKMLEKLEARPIEAAYALVALHNAGLFDRTDRFASSLCNTAFDQANPCCIAGALEKLKKADLLIPELCLIVSGHENPAWAALGLEMLKEKVPFRLDLYVKVSKHKDPVMVAIALKAINEKVPLTPSLCTKVIEHRDHDGVSRAMTTLKQFGLIRPDLCEQVLEHANLKGAYNALVKLKQHNLSTIDNCFAVLGHKDPFNAAFAIISLDFYNLLTADNRVQVLKQEDPVRAVIDMRDVLSPLKMVF